jgi:hypothetical protein
MRTQVGVSEDRADAGKRSRLRNIDTLQARMCVGAAEERRVQEAGNLDVVDKLPLPPQQRPILDPLDAATQEFGRAQLSLPDGKSWVSPRRRVLTRLTNRKRHVEQDRSRRTCA